jgi:hypothetical protein
VSDAGGQAAAGSRASCRTGAAARSASVSSGLSSGPSSGDDHAQAAGGARYFARSPRSTFAAPPLISSTWIGPP